MRVEKTKDNALNCKCLSCPSYTTTCKLKNNMKNNLDVRAKKDDEHWELMFCAMEKSNCIHENKGCLCAGCLVHRKYKLNNEDYCLHTGGVY